MEATILDTNLQAVGIMDVYKSFIWSDRYDKCGDFEIYTQVSSDVIELLRHNYYLYIPQSEHVMIIEDLNISTDKAYGNHITVTGRSLESILDRRVIWDQTIISGNLQDGIAKLLNENIISPGIPDRKISNFIFEASDDPYITSLTLDTQLLGENLYDTICSICEANSIGFKIILNTSNQFVFKLYYGADRTYEQTTNPYVVFSPEFDNIINSNYIESSKTEKTVAMVLGEGEGSSRKRTSVEIESGGGSGLTRREIYTDARDISSDTGEETLTDAQYIAQLEERGYEDLAANPYTHSFEGQVETTKMFVYGTDFFMGDVLQIENEYGMGTQARVVEVIISHNDTEGFSVYPTFSALY